MSITRQWQRGSCDKIISAMHDRTQIRHGMHYWKWHVWFITSQTCDAWFTLQISVIGVVSWICYEKLCDAWWLTFFPWCVMAYKKSVWYVIETPLCPGLLLSASCQQISLGERELTTGSNCAGKQRYGVISKVQSSKKLAQ